MTFAQPDYLYAFALIPVMALFVVWAGRRRLSALARLGDPGLIDRLSLSVDWRGRRVRNWLWFVALALLVVALARPRWGSEVQIVERQGVQIMIALDVSTSMLAEDIKPNRLKRAKLEIVDLLNRLDGDEVGLVLFSGASFLQFPLTFDYSTARTFLDEAGPQMITRPGTAIGKAIDTAVNGFNEQRAGQKVILIITDGEGHEGDPLEAARRAHEEGMAIYTVGFGSPEG
jgi:Ca-activated chloride channel family protein